jgi:hypothetical protein
MEKPPVTLGEKIAQQFKESAKAVGGFGEGLLILLVGGSPIILLLAVIAAAIIFGLRRREKLWAKKRAKKDEPSEIKEDHLE